MTATMTRFEQTVLGTCTACGATLAILHVTDSGNLCGNCNVAHWLDTHHFVLAPETVSPKKSRKERKARRHRH